MLRPLRDAIRVTIGNARFAVDDGTSVKMRRFEITAMMPALPVRAIDASLVHVTGLDVIVPASAEGTVGEPVARRTGEHAQDSGPRIAIDRFIVTDGMVRARAMHGGWDWQSRDVQLHASGVRLGAGQVATMRVEQLTLAGELRGTTFRVTHAAGTVRRQRSGEAWISLEHGRASVWNGMIAAKGGLRTGERAEVEDVVVELRDIAPGGRGEGGDAHPALPRRWSGTILGDGPFRDGIRTDARLVPADGNLAKPGAHVAIGGLVWLAPRAAIDLAVSAAGFRIAAGDSFALAMQAAMRAAGPLDRVALEGRVGATREPANTGGYTNGASAADETASVAARFDGVAALTGIRTIDMSVRADSVPFDFWPPPEAIDSVRGFARAKARVTGALARPHVTGTVDLHDGGFHVSSTVLAVNRIDGRIRFDERSASIDHLRAEANEGTIAIEGSATLAVPRTLDLRVRADSVRVAALDSPRVFAFASAAIGGSFGRPTAIAEARLIADPRLGSAPFEIATATGTAEIAKGGDIRARIIADSVPLALWPAGAAVRDVHGVASAEFDVSGKIDDPRVDGIAHVQDAGLEVAATRARITELNGRILVEDGLAEVERMRGRAGGGTIDVQAAIRLWNGPRTVNASVTADRATVMDTDSAHVIASARLSASGPLELPWVTGTLTFVEGQVHEDNFARTPPIDRRAQRYADLARSAPWISDSRLTRIEPQKPPPFRGRVITEILPGIVLYDEDSELFGTGSLTVTADSSGIDAVGLYRVQSGHFTQYGKVMRIVGGGFLFTGDGFEPRVIIHSEQLLDEPLGTGLGSGLRPLEEFPPVESFAVGSGASRVDQTTRLSLLPEPGTELAAWLLYRAAPETVTGLRAAPFYATDDGADLIGERAETQGAALLWAYFANELYDWLPISSGFLRAGAISVGPAYPGRMVIAPFITSAIRWGGLEARLTHALAGNAAPGVRLRYRFGPLEVAAFEEPWFLAAIAEGGGLGFGVRRRAGVGVRWDGEF